MHYTVRLENFEGPLDLLLFLVRKDELDINDIPIVSITEQYLAYMDLMQALNLDVAGEFLVMASTLLYLKSRALLPADRVDAEAEDAVATLDDLKRQLLEYERFKDAALRLKEQNILEKNVFTRSVSLVPPPDDDEVEIREAGLFDLLAAFRKILERTSDTEAGFDISVEHMSVKDKITEVLQMLEGCPGGIAFEQLFTADTGRIEVITTFLAMLELIKLQAIRIYQNANFSSIYIHPVAEEDDGKDAGLVGIDPTEQL